MDPDMREMLLSAWRTNNRVTIYLIENLPRELWNATVPGSLVGTPTSRGRDQGLPIENPKSKIQNRLGHIHNARCMWIKTLGAEHGIKIPQPVDRHRVTPKQLITALGRSNRGIISLLNLGFENGGTLPSSRSYSWRNLPLDVGHVLIYLTSHEAHHRGQIIMLARQLGHRLPTEITGGLWHFVKRSKEALE